MTKKESENQKSAYCTIKKHSFCVRVLADTIFFVREGSFLSKVTKFICIAAAAALLLGMSVPTVSSADGTAYILIEASTGSVLEAENADSERLCGYMAKLMSLLLIAEDIDTGRFSEEDILTASQSVSGTKGSVIWLQPGDKISVSELLKGAVIGNANDALTVLAEKSEGSLGAFTRRMNSEAFDLGLRNTHFTSPHGYPSDGCRTTAADLAKVCAELTRYPFMESYFSTWRDFVKDGSVELVNENTLARTLQGHIGFKAAHSDESGFCIAEGARSESGAVYIAVVLGAPDEDTAFSEAKRLVRKGFSDFKVTETGFPDEMLLPVKVRGGVDAAVEICLAQQSEIVVPKGADELTQRVVVPQYLSAPVKKGQRIGTAAFYCGDSLVCETPITARADVERLSFGYIMREMLSNVLKI